MKNFSIPKDGIAREKQIIFLFQKVINHFIEVSDKFAETEHFIKTSSELFELKKDDVDKLRAWAIENYGEVLTPKKLKDEDKSEPSYSPFDPPVREKAYNNSDRQAINNLIPKEGKEREEHLRNLFIKSIETFMSNSQIPCEINILASSVCILYDLTEEDERKLLSWATDVYGKVLMPKETDTPMSVHDITAEELGMSEDKLKESTEFFTGFKNNLSNDPVKRLEELKIFFDKAMMIAINEKGENNFNHITLCDAVIDLLSLDDKDKEILINYVLTTYGVPNIPEILN